MVFHELEIGSIYGVDGRFTAGRTVSAPTPAFGRDMSVSEREIGTTAVLFAGKRGPRIRPSGGFFECHHEVIAVSRLGMGINEGEDLGARVQLTGFVLHPASKPTG